MTDSLRALLTGAIDYAGMFPPAALSLEQALAQYRAHRKASASWMLGRFVCPVEKLDQLAASYRREELGPLSVIISDGDTRQTYNDRLSDGFSLVGKFPVASAI